MAFVDQIETIDPATLTVKPKEKKHLDTFHRYTQWSDVKITVIRMVIVFDWRCFNLGNNSSRATPETSSLSCGRRAFSIGECLKPCSLFAVCIYLI